MTIFLTGASGFVGTSIKKYLSNSYQFKDFKREEQIVIKQEIVLHFAGKVHDLKNTSNSNEYYEVNTELTKTIFNAFLESDAKVFIFLSTVKAAADILNSVLTENNTLQPLTHYGKSKLAAENYILSKSIPKDKRVYILRPCMIHGPGNKGNLNLLYKFVSIGIPWPLGAFENKRSYCSIDNLIFIVKELIENNEIESGVYNVADNETISTNELISLIAESQFKMSYIMNIPQCIIKSIFHITTLFRLPLTTLELSKLTGTYVVSNEKIKKAIYKPLPVTAKEGLMNTLNSFRTSISN